MNDDDLSRPPRELLLKPTKKVKVKLGTPSKATVRAATVQDQDGNEFVDHVALGYMTHLEHLQGPRLDLNLDE